MFQERSFQRKTARLWLTLAAVCFPIVAPAQSTEAPASDGSCGAAILIETTVPCSVMIDDRDLGKLEKYGAARAEVLRGEHVVLARSPAGGVLLRETIAVEGGGQRMVSIKAPSHPIIDIGNGTVEDIRTGLIWPARDNGRDINWVDAREYCGALELGGHDDWRLPKLEELKRLYDPDRPVGPKILDGIELTDDRPCCLSSTMNKLSTTVSAAWGLYFHYSGKASRQVNSAGNNRALCVREP